MQPPKAPGSPSAAGLQLRPRCSHSSHGGGTAAAAASASDPPPDPAAEQQGWGPRWCSRCEVWAPMRSKHCRHCNRCVAGFDHHCFWLATCVGRRSHDGFIVYLCLHVSVNAVVIHQALTALKHASHTVWGAAQWATVGLALTLFATFCLLGGLLLLHLFLVSANLTTYECFQQHRVPYLRALPPGVSPFSKGVGANWRHFLGSRADYDRPATRGEAAAAAGLGEQGRAVATLFDNPYYSGC